NEIIKCNVSNSIFIKEPTRYIYKEYMNSEFLVLSSRAEGFGLVLAEAMSCGRPCVSFNCPCGPDEIITDGVDGLLAKNGDVDDLAEKMEWMITHDKERKEMGIRARESAKRYDKEKIMTQWINLFNELTNNTNI
ncbi:MAG TPA: glycosyltransferase, partial [Thomasclavelia ramosa]|nr:glycosyltransferase [Thomasclavelia ramosa]